MYLYRSHRNQLFKRKYHLLYSKFYFISFLSILFLISNLSSPVCLIYEEMEKVENWIREAIIMREAGGDTKSHKGGVKCTPCGPLFIHVRIQDCKLAFSFTFKKCLLG